MNHSKQCMEVLSRCDFPEDCYVWVEKLCLRYTSKQIISLIWSKDKKGVHDWDWFDSFFSNGYIPIIKNVINIDMNEEFWIAYNIICKRILPFSIDDMGLISDMSGDTLRLEEAINKSKPNIKYLHKVWQDTEIEHIVVNNSQLIDIKKHKVETHDIT